MPHIRANAELSRVCTVKQFNPTTKVHDIYIEDLRCNLPSGLPPRLARAYTDYDYRVLHAYTEVPAETTPIHEGMRLVYSSGGDYRIHSINKWPAEEPEYLELILQGDAHG